ncbi:hypothetical protein [Streptomyces sedi]|uniref:hypothetical protein n=1 Tax=Streptomyces sedi TaxID=555059 RepID=UPI0026D96E4F
MYGAVVAASALVLTACGGDDSGKDDEIAGVETPSDEPEASEDPEPTEEPDDGRPEIDLGADYENVFEGEPTGDPLVDAALRDNEGFENAVAEAIVHHDVERPALRYFVAGDALIKTLNALSNIQEGGNTSTGVVRYFDRNVTILEGEESATFSYCRDFSQVVTVDFETREVVSEEEPDAMPSFYSGRMELNEAGVWQTVAFEQESESPECV